MTEKEAIEILQFLEAVKDHLINGEDRQAFYYMGVLSEYLSRLAGIDKKAPNFTLHEYDDEPFQK